MILPLIIRSTEEALKSVPGYIPGSKLRHRGRAAQTVFMIVLSFGGARDFGRRHFIHRTDYRRKRQLSSIRPEPSRKFLESLFDSGRTLAIHMYALSREGLNTNEAYATAVILLLSVLLLNTLAAYLAKKIAKTGR
jgi:phosphate transport system permease protein